MTAQQKELFHLAILRVLDSNRTRFGLGMVAIGHHLPQFGFGLSSFDCEKEWFEELSNAIDYLTSKRLVEEVLKHVDRANRAWRITTEGIDYVDQRG